MLLVVKAKFISERTHLYSTKKEVSGEGGKRKKASKEG
jgi:hypothetical protein